MEGVGKHAVNQKTDVCLRGIILRNIVLIVVKKKMKRAAMIRMRHQCIGNKGKPLDSGRIVGISRHQL